MRRKKITVALVSAGIALGTMTVAVPSSATAATVGACPTGLRLVPGSQTTTTSWGSAGKFGGTRTTWRCTNADGSITAIGQIG